MAGAARLWPWRGEGPGAGRGGEGSGVGGKAQGEGGGKYRIKEPQEMLRAAVESIDALIVVCE